MDFNKKLSSNKSIDELLSFLLSQAQSVRSSLVREATATAMCTNSRINCDSTRECIGLAEAGTGMSHAAKSMFLPEYQDGIKQTVIDLECEFRSDHR